MLLVVNVGVDLAIWTVGVTMVSGRFSRQNLKKAFSPPAVAVLIGLPLNYLGGRELLPDAVLSLIDMLAVCAIPIGIFIIGVAFCELARESGAKLRLNVVAGSVLMRHLLLPALMLGAAWLIPFSPAVRDVILVHAAMPCGVFPVVLAKHYGGAGNLAFQAVATSCPGRHADHPPVDQDRLLGAGAISPLARLRWFRHCPAGTWRGGMSVMRL